MGLVLDAYGKPTSPSLFIAHRWIADEARYQERARAAAARVRELRLSVLGHETYESRTITVRPPKRYAQC